MLDLHDAVLEELRIDYQAGTAVIVFKTAAGKANLTAEGVLMVRAPRREPWGSGGSASVNEVRGPAPIYAEASAVQVEIELQSGDLLEIEARKIVIAAASLIS